MRRLIVAFVPLLASPAQAAFTARGTAEGRDESFETAVFGTPWSDPIGVEVRSDFRRAKGVISGPRSRTPRFTFSAEFPAEAAGGRATVTLYRVRGCRRHAHRLTKLAPSYRGRFDARRLRITVHRPRRDRYYFGRFTFAGTRFLRAGDDPNPMLLQVQSGRIEYVAPRDFPPCG